MKILSALLTILILVLAVALACDCCPTIAKDGMLGIEKNTCHSCCPGSSEIARDCGTLHEKQALSVPHGSLMTDPAIQVNAAYRIQEEKSLQVAQHSPPLGPLSLSTVLRI